MFVRPEGSTVNASRKPLRASGPAHRKKMTDVRWLDLDALATVTIVVGRRHVVPGHGRWSADSPGEQLIDVRFHQPTSVGRLRVVSSEGEQARTQELTIWASLRRGEQHREVLRRLFTFNPHGATEEVEEHTLQLEGVSAIQVRIVPCVDGSPAVAHVRELRIARD